MRCLINSNHVRSIYQTREKTTSEELDYVLDSLAFKLSKVSRFKNRLSKVLKEKSVKTRKKLLFKYCSGGQHNS
jgi:hypothetical protein